MFAVLVSVVPTPQPFHQARANKIHHTLAWEEITLAGEILMMYMAKAFYVCTDLTHLRSALFLSTFSFLSAVEPYRRSLGVLFLL